MSGASALSLRHGRYHVTRLCRAHKGYELKVVTCSNGVPSMQVSYHFVVHRDEHIHGISCRPQKSLPAIVLHCVLKASDRALDAAVGLTAAGARSSIDLSCRNTHAPCRCSGEQSYQPLRRTTGAEQSVPISSAVSRCRTDTFQNSNMSES